MIRKNFAILIFTAILMSVTAYAFADNTSQEMYKAIGTGDIATVKALLDNGYAKDALLPNGQPPLMCAAQAGNAEIVSLLISYGADVSIQASDRLGGNSLTGAIWSTRDTHDSANTIKIIQMLLDAGIDINSGEIRDESSDFESGGKKMKSYKNPIWFAACSSDYSADVIEFMMNKGCSLSGSYAISEDGTERHDSGVDDLSDAAKKSKSNKADRKEYNRIQKILKNAEKSPLPAVLATLKITKSGEPQQVQPEPTQPEPAPVLAETEPEPSPSFVLTPSEATKLLQKSAAEKNLENFYRALAMGADVNYADKENKTALLLAVMSQNYEMTEVLLYKGAGVNVKSKGGNTPLSMARDLGAKDIEQLLLKAGAKN